MKLPFIVATTCVALLALLICAPGAPAAENPAGQPPFGAEPLAPLEQIRDRDRDVEGFAFTAAEAIAIADANDTIRAERQESPLMRARAFTRGTDRWQISYFAPGGKEVAQAVVSDPGGEVIEAYRDQQVEVKLARGYEDAVAGNVNEAWIWIPLCLAFFLPFFDPKRPLRLLHLDLLVLLGFSVSQFFFQKGEIVASVPLVYPVLGYLFVRTLWAGFRPREGSGPLIPIAPVRLLAWGAVALAAFRIGFNLVDSQVIDIGFAGVVGADRISSGEGIYDGRFTPLIDRGDSYGPFNYLLYVPFEAIFPYGGGLEPLPAAHALAITFDLAVVGLLLLAGRRLRPGGEGRALGIALAYAWLAYPYTLYALNANGNDAVVAAFVLGALLLVGRPVWSGIVLALGAAAKFGPLALAPLLAAGRGARRRRSAVAFGAPFVLVWLVVLLPLLPDGGFGEFYDRTFGYQASRGSPFSIWGLEPSLEWLQELARGFAIALGAALFFLPRRRDLTQLAALAAAILLATQVGSEHWFYFFIVWWAPLVLLVAFAPHERVAGRDGAWGEDDRDEGGSSADSLTDGSSSGASPASAS
ncbi:MAG: glycosyltransferase family 87 protein [Solirubrobacterales bacterium]